MVPTAAGQVAESTGKLTVGLALCLYLLHRGAGAPLCAAGAIGGVTAGAGLGLLVTALLLPRRASLPPVRDVPPARRDIARQLLRDGVPITVGAAGMSLITLLDQTLVTGTLQKHAALFGGGDGRPVRRIYLRHDAVRPAAVVYLSPVGEPDARRVRRPDPGRPDGRRESRCAAMKLTVLTALPAGVGLSVLAEPILLLLYPAVPDTARAAAYHLTFLGLACVFVCLMVAANGVLQAYGHPLVPVLALLCGGVLKVVTNYLMVGDPATGIRGAAVSTPVLLRADRAYRPDRHRPAGAGASGLYTPVRPPGAGDGGDGAGRPFRLRPFLPGAAGALGGAAYDPDGGGGICDPGAGCGRCDPHGRGDAAAGEKIADFLHLR